ncbi:DUF5682 family protein [Ramlibacter sp. WS9]|uniref:DUF5682 family protein n=1 Tax=Ramlibacter sp. WS9 TaxID=1882741 RepID=UPI001144CB5E|nr:DUF5682 family protein [Ramlibacter sp. WS9]ROZ74308.1 hypothetical protein EEB15_17310 [Ramlibacter sp. WS9]
MQVRVLGVRHHSPACARLVRHAIERDQPAAVLIEGPADFNARMGELLLDHQLPVALYSYANEGASPAQCWFPFLDYSPEWVALRAAHAQGALLRFIDLPHWQYRAIPDARAHIGRIKPERSRYADAVQALCRRFGCDGDNALWDQLFETVEDDTALRERLDLYFDELRGDDPGTPQDQARELQMARWVAWATRQVGGGSVLVVCGGWHKRAIEQLWPRQSVLEEPVTSPPEDVRAAGCYLVPYAWRQVDALGGYWSGMQSPMFYQWVWDHGLPAAGERAIAQIVRRLRAKDVPLSTADLMAMRESLGRLAHLRGRAHPLRGDILDALQSAVIKEALEAPPPWVDQGLLGAHHHPVQREALIALTGEGGGSLHADTPLPPLVHDIVAQLAQCGLEAKATSQKHVIDRRRADDEPRARLLWRLQLIGVRGARLAETKAPLAARNLPPTLRFEEHWTLVQDERWFPDVIEAAAYGATLEAAARQRLAEAVRGAGGDVARAAHALLQAMRAGLHDMGAELARQLEAALPQAHDLGALAGAARVLLEVVQAGFWGQDTRILLEGALAAVAARILVLLDDRQGPAEGQALEADVAAVGVLDTMLRQQLEGAAGLDRTALLDTLLRLARTPTAPPALRGAALAVSYGHDHLGDQAAEQILALLRAVPPRDALGDFLFGLFSCARALATGSGAIVAAVHEALEAMSTDDFLVALPQLRAAFTWFPPRERGAVADRVAALLGLSAMEQQRLLTLRSGTDALLDAKRVEAQALEWARALGLAA